MSNPVTCKISGLDELQAKLEALEENVAKKGMRGALKEGGAVVREQMENRAPDHTGFLRSHFNTKTSMRGRNELAGSVFIGPDNAVYPKHLASRVLSDTLRLTKKAQKAFLKNFKGRISVVSVCRYLEFGTSKMSAKPFMVAAFKSVTSKALAAVTKALREAIDEAT
jgi:HK97 gp10 family phage protein